jgi:hypothetical protein
MPVTKYVQNDFIFLSTGGTISDTPITEINF